MKKLTSFDLKLIAIITMTIDHIGYHIFPQVEVYRIIGRICFPIIAFLIAEGYRHTSNLNKYISRLGLFAIIIQIALATTNTNFYNIFFTLTLGLILIHSIEQRQYSIIFPVIIIPFFIPVDYGYYGILTIVLMYYTKIWVSLAFLINNLVFIYILPKTFLHPSSMHEIQIYSLLALPLIFMYNGRQGKKMKYFFYVYYPLHIAVILLIKEYIYGWWSIISRQTPWDDK